jgi:hypothetical protein
MRVTAKLHVERGLVRLEVHRGRHTSIESAPYEDRAGLGAAVERLLAETVYRKQIRALDILVDRPVLQRRLLQELPPVHWAMLPELVARQSHRYFRQNGRPLVTAAVWVTRKGSSGRTAVLVAVEEPLADLLVQAAIGSGVRVRSLRAGGDLADLPLFLLPPAERGRRRQTRWKMTRRLAIGVGCVWLAAALFAVARLRGERVRIEAELARLREPREALAAARRTLESAAAMVQAVRQAERDRWELGRELAWLTNSLPDSAVVTDLELSRDGSAVLRGLARRPLELQAAMERAGGSRRTRFEATGVRENAAGVPWERFTARLGPLDSRAVTPDQSR